MKRRDLSGKADLIVQSIRRRESVASLVREVESLRAALLAAEADRQRMDWLSAHVIGDQTICPPGNHGGGAGNWLISQEDESKHDSYGRWGVEHEGSTLREAIDAARSSSPTTAPND